MYHVPENPSGYIVGIDSAATVRRLYIIQLPQAAVPDASAPMAKLASGKGNRENLLQFPVAVGCTAAGAILVLDSVLKKILAFDVAGNALMTQFADPAGPAGATSSQMSLNVQAPVENYLDMAIESKGFIFVLVYETDNPTPEDYRIDIYNPDGTFLATATAIRPNTSDQPMPAACVTIDLFRNLYTLNYDSFQGPGGRLEPSISTLIPTL